MFILIKNYGLELLLSELVKLASFLKKPFLFLKKLLAPCLFELNFVVIADELNPFFL